MILLETKKLNISFSGIQVLFDLDFQLKENEIHCLCGENGAGKSTLVKILTGIYPHYIGDILINDKVVKISNPRIARELGIYAVQQHRDLVPTMNAVENIFLGNEIYINKNGKQLLNFAEMKERSAKIIDKFGINIDLDLNVGDLKVSEQGIVAICKALITESKILLIDEASAPLDDAERKVLYSTLKKLRDEGRGIVYITHHLDEVFKIGDRTTVLRNGRNVRTVDMSEYDRSSLIMDMTGNVKMYDRKHGNVNIQKSSKPILEFYNVSNKYLKSISFKAYEGEIIGFAGLEGSYKTEIASVMFGLSKYNEGMIKYKGEVLVSEHPIQSIRLGIGMVPTDRKNLGLITCRSVSENIILTKINKEKKIFINSSWIKKVASSNIIKLGIKTSSQNQLVEYLSGGNQQKVLLSKWIEAGVNLLLLIEPTEGIDVGTRIELFNIFKGLSSDGKTLILFTSDLDEIMALSDRIFTMVEGKIIGEYLSNEAKKQKILSEILSK